MNRETFMGKCDDTLKVHVPSELKDELKRLSVKNDRGMSDYVRHVLTIHVIIDAALSATQAPERTSQGHAEMLPKWNEMVAKRNRHVLS